MYYSATGTGYVSTPSFAILDTGILTIESWMKSKLSTTVYQTILGDNGQSATVGFIRMSRNASTNGIYYYYYANGVVAESATFSNFFLNLDNQ